MLCVCYITTSWAWEKCAWWCNIDAIFYTEDKFVLSRNIIMKNQFINFSKTVNNQYIYRKYFFKELCAENSWLKSGLVSKLHTPKLRSNISLVHSPSSCKIVYISCTKLQSFINNYKTWVGLLKIFLQQISYGTLRHGYITS